jgi:hypothetical protein
VVVKKIAIVGTISNVEHTLESNLRRLIRACSDFEIAVIFLVESDSNDKTIEVLKRLSSDISCFRFVSLGELKKQIPDRISRIRHCRNFYVAELRRLQLGIEYVVVADLDGMNSRITRSGFNSSFLKSDWSAVLANQIGGYYDLLALRHPEWCPKDILTELKEEQERIDKSHLSFFAVVKRFQRRFAFDRARDKTVYSRMRKIGMSSDWISVHSGFGGLGIYRLEYFKNFDYSLQTGDSSHESEHVSFSRRIIDSGGKIFINPRMINNFYNTYNINRFFVVRQVRELYWNARKRLKIQLKRR